MFPKIGVPQYGWFIMENPIKMDDLGGTNPYFWRAMHIISYTFKKDQAFGRLEGWRLNLLHGRLMQIVLYLKIPPGTCFAWMAHPIHHDLPISKELDDCL